MNSFNAFKHKEKRQWGLQGVQFDLSLITQGFLVRYMADRSAEVHHPDTHEPRCGPFLTFKSRPEPCSNSNCYCKSVRSAQYTVNNCSCPRGMCGGAAKTHTRTKEWSTTDAQSTAKCMMVQSNACAEDSCSTLVQHDLAQCLKHEVDSVS
jgi:hypothetical protein